MSFGLLEFGLLVITLIFCLYYYLTKNYDFWAKRNVHGPKPVLLYGNYKDILQKKIHPADYFKQLYDAYPDEPVIGIYKGIHPALILRDPEIVKDVLIKSFPNFADRGFRIHKDIDPLAQHVIYMEPKRWKPMRRKLTPVFTSGKLKEMFYLINDCTEVFANYLDRLVAKNEPIECRELAAQFMTNVIGVCAFGLNINALTEEENEFRKVGRSFFEPSLWNKTRRFVRSLPHWMAVLLKPIARNDKIINFFVYLVKDNMEFRRQNKIRRNDFIDLLMDIKDNPDQDSLDLEMDDMLLTAQAFVFFIAGFETSSSTLSSAMYELALNPEIQDKLREEVNAAFEQNDGKLTYGTIKNMKYLDKVFKETLRMYPPAYHIQRQALEDHTFENAKITIPKGTKLYIPLYSIHRDLKYYPEPDKFDPERFHEESEQKIPSMCYLPFLDGPRLCLGKRFAEIQTKLSLAFVVHRFILETCEKTCIPFVKSTKNTRFLAPMNGVYLRVKKI